MTPALSIVICTRDRPELLTGALESLTHLDPAVEVVVVDSASRDAAAVARVAQQWNAHLVRLDLPGASRARNAGLLAAAAPIVAFTDDDCRAEPGWDEAILAAFSADPKLGFVTGPALPDRQARLPLSVSDRDPARSITPDDDPWTCGHGANMAFRREAWLSVGGMDEVLGAGGPLRAAEDVDLFWRLLRAGWPGRHDPDAAVTHVQWRATGAAMRTMYSYGIGSGAVAVKAMRLGDPVGRRFLRMSLLDRGLLDVWRSLRAGWQSERRSC